MAMPHTASVLRELFCQARMARAQDSVVPGAPIAAAAGSICGEESGPRPKWDCNCLSSSDPQRPYFSADTPQIGNPHPELDDEIVAHLPKDLLARSNANSTEFIAKRSASMRCLFGRSSTRQPVASIRG
jgi:hypothetical protein